MHTLCRSCLSDDVDVSMLGVYAPFFRARVDISRDPFEREGRTQVLACRACHCRMPLWEWGDAELEPLYRDYRQDSYNRERIAIEPGYAAIVDKVGITDLPPRRAGADKFLADVRARTILDYAGGDGAAVPPRFTREAGRIDVYDRSSNPVQGYARKIDAVTDDYDLVLAAHILEHVGHPRQFLHRLAGFGQMVYVEIPLEMGPIDSPFGLHEHINQFSFESVLAMGLTVLRAEKTIVDVTYGSGWLGRYLLRGEHGDRTD